MKREELLTLQDKIRGMITPCDDSNPLSLELVSFNKGVLEVRLLGSCRNCPAAQETFEETVRAQILRSDPRIESVILNTEMDPEILEFARAFLNRRKEDGE